MYENSRELINILKCFLFEKKYVMPENLVPEEVMEIAHVHDVDAMAGTVLEKSGAELSENCKKRLALSKVQCGILGAMREKLFNEISDALTNADIENIIVKGYVLRELYPIKDLRTMTDIDFVIRRKDGSEMERVMADLGYEMGEVLNGDWDFFKNKMHIEFHERLTESELGNGFDYDKYLSDCFNYTVEYKGMTKALDVEYHLIYMFIHCAKHFYNGGCGFRMIMDFAAYLKCYNDIINWKYIKGELKKIRLYDFSNNIWYLCQEWFDIKAENRTYTMDKELYYELLGFIAMGGTFGEVEAESRMVRKTARETIEKGSKNSITSLWIKLKRYVLLDDESMRGIIPWYKDKPKVLLPAAWIYKGVMAVNKKGMTVTKDIIASGANDEAAVKEYNMLKALGLYRK